ncbi:hypothetical protein J6590_029555 [Homalodisca vitripennis]|nr:hypothetical protein J6590_029555 [Homalodisca vitripennis]
MRSTVVAVITSICDQRCDMLTELSAPRSAKPCVAPARQQTCLRLYSVGVPMAEWSKTLDFESELEIAKVQILSVTVALFISTIDLVLYRLSLLLCIIRSSHRSSRLSGREDFIVLT